MHVTHISAVSIDGRIAQNSDELDLERVPYGFMSGEDKSHVENELKSADAVITGASSLKATGRAFEIENDSGRFPSWIVFTNSGLPSALPFFKQECLERILISKDALERVNPLPGGVANLCYKEKNPAEFVINLLETKKFKKVLLFGGSTISKMFYERGLVDELVLTVCPVIFAKKGGVPLIASDLLEPVKLTLETSHSSSNLVFLRYRVQSS